MNTINNIIKGFYFITGGGLSRAGDLSDVRDAISAGVEVVQYRNKKGTYDEVYQEALRIKELCKNITFLINDHVDIALAVDACGVHLGQDDLSIVEARKLLKNKIIGISTHDLEQAITAEELGADYIGVGPIFKTATKKNTPPCGISLIHEVKKVCSLPIVAIGGINHDNVQEIIEAGADAICAISAVVNKTEPQQEIKRFQELFNERLE